MKASRFLVAVFFVMAGCATQDDRNCVDYKQYTYPFEKCLPMHGSMICVTEMRVHTYCVQWEDNGDTTKRESESQGNV
jgi:hypothetical protein